ncbi:hypothetical protein K435DRAFT_607535, partial [Dendrothele bispora CBS 962.96]
YRIYLLTITDHFYTISEEIDRATTTDGYNDEGIEGHVYFGDSPEGCGGELFFRMYNRRGEDHFYTMSSGE